MVQLNGSHLKKLRLSIGLSQAKLSELSGVPQHHISAFELGKTELPLPMLERVQTIMRDKSLLENTVAQPKRYQNHEYSTVPILSSRSSRIIATEENHKYLSLLKRLYDSHVDPSNRTSSAISLFSGIGGMSLGFSAAGYDIKGFLELEEGLRRIYQLNFPNCRMLGSDIQTVDLELLRNDVGDIDELDVIIGGPPCQGFSLSGKRQIDDPRNTLFKHYMKFVDTFRPKAAVLENVRLLTSMKNPDGGFVKDDIINEFTNHGYRTRLFEINAKNYGVPQHRERVLFVAFRDDLLASPSIPEPTHGMNESLFSKSYPYRTFADACSDLPFIESGEVSSDPFHQAVRHPKHVIDWLWNVEEGCSAHENKDPSMRPPSGYNTTYKRQIWEEPASTVQTTFGMISGCRNVHPIATRSLTIREAARIQSFPDSFHFDGSLGAIRTGIGNAVPPLLAFAVAVHLRKRLSSL